MEMVAGVLVDGCLTPDRLPVVPISQWYSKLQAAVESANETLLVHVPAIKLAEFFGSVERSDHAIRSEGVESAEGGGMSLLSTVRAQSASPYLRALPQLSSKDVRHWIDYWTQKGFLG
jgi:hypothetical protein